MYLSPGSLESLKGDSETWLQRRGMRLARTRGSLQWSVQSNQDLRESSGSGGARDNVEQSWHATQPGDTWEHQDTFLSPLCGLKSWSKLVDESRKTEASTC